jgi:hypothetical protein
MSATFHHILNCLFIIQFLIMDTLKVLRLYLSVALISRPLIMIDWMSNFHTPVGHFLCLLLRYTYLVLLFILALFLVSLQLIELLTQSINPKSGMSLQIFSHILGHLFILLTYFILKKVFEL